MNCSVLGCTSRDEIYQECQDITFHEFPSDTNIHKIWIKCTGRQNWEPTNNNRMCFKHFKLYPVRKSNSLHRKTVPELIINKSLNKNLKPLHQVQESSQLPKNLAMDCQMPQTRKPFDFCEVMEGEKWPVQKLEEFAAAYLRYNVLYTKPLSLHSNSSTQKMDQHEQQGKALEQLAGCLGLPNDDTFDQICSEFRRQLLSYVRCRVRQCLICRKPYTSALTNSLPNIAQLAKKLNLLVVAVRTELSCRGSPTRCWAVDALTRELCDAVRRHYNVLGTGPEHLPSDMLARASIAVFSGAKHLTKDLWLRMCTLRKQQLLKLSLVGDRSDLLRPSERLVRIDWQLVDALLMYAPDDVMILTAESLLPWRDLLRALTVLVELLAAARASSPASCTPLAQRTTLWKGVHNAYTNTGRSATVVLLQRRWQQLLQMTRAASRRPGWPRSAHSLLVMVAACFPRVISKRDVSWRALVRNGLVATTNDVESTSGDDKLILDIDFTQLERCMTTNEVILYITTKLKSEHKNYVNTVIVDSSENSDCELDDSCNNLNKVTDSCRSLSDTEQGTLDNTIHSNHTINLDSDSEVEKLNEEQDKLRDKTTKNQPYFEIDTSKVDDYVRDLLMEVENLKTLDELKNPADDLDTLDSYKIMKDSKVKAESSIDLINWEDDNASNNLIDSSKTVQQLCPASTMWDSKLFSMPRVQLKRVDETEPWRSHASLDNIDVNNYQSSVKNIKLFETTYLSDTSTESDEEIDDVVKNCYDKESRNPDLNPVLKGLTNNFWKKNRRLMELCSPALVRVGRLRESELPGGERAVKRVKLPDIDEVRRTNRNILTAQVKPINVQNHELKRAKAVPQLVLQSAHELAHTPLAADLALLQTELEELFALPPPLVDDMLIASKYDNSWEKESANDYNLSYHDWLKSRQSRERTVGHRIPKETTAGKNLVKKRHQHTTVKDKYLEVGMFTAETETDVDLDDMLRCTIIKKPVTRADKPETDVATQPFFISSNEKLVASNFGSSTPVITDICSLAEKDAVLVNDRMSNPSVRRPSHSCRSKPLKEPVRRPSQPSHDINTTQQVCESRLVMNGLVNLEDDTVMTPSDLTIRRHPIQKKQDELSPCSKFSLPKQYGRFNDPANKLASLTPVIVRDADTSTIKLVPPQHTATQQFTSACITALPEKRQQSVTTTPLTSLLVPALVTANVPTNDLQLGTPMTPSMLNTQRMPVAMTSQISLLALQLVPIPTMTAPMSSQMPRNAPGQFQEVTMRTPKLSTNAMQPMSTFTMTSPMVMTSQTPVTNEPQIMPALPVITHALLPVSNNFNIIGLRNKLDGEITLDPELSTIKWVDPGRIEPPSALVLNRSLSPKDYITIHGRRNLTVVKLDSSVPLWTVAEEYLILADMNLPCLTPTYWTVGSTENCTQLVWPESVDESTPVNVKKPQEMDTSSIVIGDLIGNYPFHEIDEGSDMDSELKDGEIAVVNVSDSDSDDGQRESKRATTSSLRVKSFAKCERMGANALGSDKTGSRDVTKHADQYFKKLTDNPVRYTLMLTTVSSTHECDRLLRDHVALHVWNRRTGALSPLDVMENPLSQLPTRMAGAVLIRHADPRFLKDMARKLQCLNSANPHFNENRTYVFAHPPGTPLVASSNDLNDMERANLLLQNSGNNCNNYVSDNDQNIVFQIHT